MSAAEDLLHYLSTGEDPHGRISPEVIAEMNFPHVSFALEGKAALDEARDQVSDHPWVIRAEPAVPTQDGFVVVLDYDAGRDGQDATFRTVSLVTVENDQVTRFRHWCTGELQQ